MKMSFVVLVMLCIFVVRYHCFLGTYRLHLRVEDFFTRDGDDMFLQNYMASRPRRPQSNNFDYQILATPGKYNI